MVRLQVDGVPVPIADDPNVSLRRLSNLELIGCAGIRSSIRRFDDIGSHARRNAEGRNSAAGAETGREWKTDRVKHLHERRLGSGKRDRIRLAIHGMPARRHAFSSLEPKLRGAQHPSGIVVVTRRGRLSLIMPVMQLLRWLRRPVRGLCSIRNCHGIPRVFEPELLEKLFHLGLGYPLYFRASATLQGNVAERNYSR